MRIILGIEGVRRLWRIRKIFSKRPGISGEVLHLSDGGKNSWNCINCHLIETTLKEHAAKTEEEFDYLNKVMNPCNVEIGISF